MATNAERGQRRLARTTSSRTQEMLNRDGRYVCVGELPEDLGSMAVVMRIRGRV